MPSGPLHHSVQGDGLALARWLNSDKLRALASTSHRWPQQTAPGIVLRHLRCTGHSQPPLTWSLEIERHHLGATQPEAEGVVVGRVHPLSLGVNAGQALLIVFQEIVGFLSDDAVSLCLHEGADFSEVGVFCTKRGSRIYSVSCTFS